MSLMKWRFAMSTPTPLGIVDAGNIARHKVPVRRYVPITTWQAWPAHGIRSLDTMERQRGTAPKDASPAGYLRRARASRGRPQSSVLSSPGRTEQEVVAFQLALPGSEASKLTRS